MKGITKKQKILAVPAKGSLTLEELERYTKFLETHS